MADAPQSRQPPTPYDEAVYNQLDENGNRLPSGALSLSEIEVVDLISEGEIEGLVTGEYPLTGSVGFAGEVGWRSYNFSPYRDAPNTTVKYLRSIYWNETPLVSSDNKYNYQRVSISKTNGTAAGSLLDSTNQEVTVSRQLNERLRGSVSNIDGSSYDDNKDYAKYYRILNKDCRGIYLNVRFNTLYAYIIAPGGEFGEASVGLQKDTSVEYNIYYRPLFSSQTPTESGFILAKKEVVRGRITQGYIKQTRIDFLGNFPDQQDFLGYEIKVIRLTPDFINISLNQDIKNSTVIDSLTEIYNNTFVYPHSAMVRSKFTADFFSSVPGRSYDVKLLKVKIPNTYDPILKRYSESAGGWDGTFKTAKEWTDNPAWCFYDLVTNKRYGLGNYIDETYVDKWSLYEIAKYCDTLVPDGYGTLEPRFSCNLIINNRDDAYKVVNSMSSVFRAINYYACGSIYTVQDSPKDPVYLFSNSNVKDGDFSYQSSSRRVRHSVALIRFNDKDNFYKPAIEYVENAEAIRQYGLRTVELTAYGCTSRGQANRLGKWALISENLETDTVSFGGGLECSFLRPGDLIKTFDANRKTVRYAGRTSQIENRTGVGFTGSIITLDSEISLPNTGSMYSFNLLTPTYFYDSAQVSDITSSGYADVRRNQIQQRTFTGNYLSGVTGQDSGVRSQITLYSGFNTGDYIVSGNLVWTIELLSGRGNSMSGIANFGDSSRYIDSNYDWWRVVSIKEEKQAEYSVSAIQHNPNKFALVETGLYFQAPVDQPVTTPTTPTNLVVATEKPSKYSARVLFSAVLPNDSGVTSYKIFAQQGNTGFIVGNTVPTDDYLVANLPKESSAGYYNIPATGAYYFRAYSVNDVNGKYSTGYATGLTTITSHFPIQDVSISSLNLDDSARTHSGYRTTGSYFILNPAFTWQVGIDSESTLGQNFTYRASIRQPSNSNTPSSTIYFQTTGWQANPSSPTFPFYFNQNCLISGGPYREYDIVIEAMDASGRTSAGNQIGSTETWSNPYGYDILYVNFPRLTGFALTTGANTTNFFTNQWLDSEGTATLNIISGILPPLIEGGYMYANTGLFTTGQATSGTHCVTLEMTPIDIDAKIYKSAVRLSQFNSGWMAVSFYDTWDKALRDKGVSIERYLTISNIVPVYGTGSFYNVSATNSVSIIDPSDYLSSSIYTTETVTEDSKQYVVTYVTDEEGVKKTIGSRIK